MQERLTGIFLPVPGRVMGRPRIREIRDTGERMTYAVTVFVGVLMLLPAMAIMMMIVPIPSAVADAMAADVEADIDSEDVHAGAHSVSDMRAPADDAADLAASADIAMVGMGACTHRSHIGACPRAVRTGLRACAHGPSLGAAAHAAIALGKGSPGCENSHG